MELRKYRNLNKLRVEILLGRVKDKLLPGFLDTGCIETFKLLGSLGVIGITHMKETGFMRLVSLAEAFPQVSALRFLIILIIKKRNVSEI